MHALDRVAHLFGRVDEVVVLAVQVFEQAADADLVVVIGALERGHFVLHERLELGGARERAFDAVAHGGDFAADRLADIDDGFARRGFRLAEPHRDLRHRLRDETHLARAVDHLREHEEKSRRQQEDRGRAREWRGRHCRPFAGRAAPSKRTAGQASPRQPSRPRRRCSRCARHARLQRLQDLTDRFPVVVGGPARLVAGDADVAEQVIVRRGRSDAAGRRDRGGLAVRKI